MKATTFVLLNICMFTGWVIIAIHFDRWWIALFALLTVYSIDKSKE